MWQSDVTRMGDCQTFILYNPSQLPDVEIHARQHSKPLMKVNVLEVGSDVALVKLADAKRLGMWILFFNDHEQCSHEFLRTVAREVVLPNRVDLHEEFRVWLLTTQPLETLPALIIQHCIRTPTIDPTVEFSSLASKELVVDAESGFLFGVRANRDLLREMPPAEQVELFRRAKNEEVCLALLEGRTEFVQTAQDAGRHRVLDVAITRQFFVLVARIVELGGRTELLDFDDMLRPANQRMLHLLLRNHGEAFDTRAAVRKTVAEGNVAVMKSLFEARVDVGFRSEDYPLADCIARGHQELTQVIIDRMERVGLPPLHEGDIAFQCLQGLLELPRDEDFTPFVLDMASRFAGIVYGEYPVDPEAVARIVRVCPDHPLLPHLLHIVDVKRRPGDFFTFFLRYDPTSPLTANCLRAFLRLITSRHPNVELSKQQLLRRIILRGDEATPLVKIVLDDGVTSNYRLEIALPDGALPQERTALMQCMELPGHAEALKVVLRQPTVDVNMVNERGLNALAQTVVDILNAPQAYMYRQELYGRMVHDLLLAGIDPHVEPPAFYTTLFAYVARLEFAHLCIPLLPCTPDCNVILHTSENLLAMMVNICLDRVHQGLMGVDGVLDIRFAVPTPRDEYELWRSLLPLPLPTVLAILSFGSAADLVGWGQVNVRWYFLSLHHALWQALCMAEGADAPQLGPLASHKLRYMARRVGRTPHLYYTDSEGKQVCAYTGEVRPPQVSPDAEPPDPLDGW